MESKNIYQRINAVMKDCDYLKKEGAQQGKGVKYDTVIAMIRGLLIKHGIVMVVVQPEMKRLFDVEGTKQKVFQGYYEMFLVNIDNPEDRVVHTTYAHGMDGGDKAPGKAQTYAVKIMLVKAFGIETGEDDESRAEKIDKKNLITQSQYEELYRFCVDGSGEQAVWSEKGKKVLAAYNIQGLNHLPASKFEEVMAICKS